MRLRPLLRCSAILLGVLALALTAFVLSFDINRYRHQVEAAASQALGRAVTLGGPLSLGTSLLPTIAAEQVGIANPAWASRPHLARAAHAEIQIELLPLLRGQVVLRQIGLDGADLLLETTSEGANNWTFGETAGGAPGIPRPPDSLTIAVRHSTLAYRSPTSHIALTLVTAQADVAEDRPFRLSFQGTFRGVPLTLDLEGGTPTDFRASPARWPITLSLRAPDASLTAQGTAALQADAPVIDLRGALSGGRLDALNSLLGSEMPPLGPYELAGRVSTTVDGIALTDLKARLGDTDVAGDVTLALAGARPRLVGRLTSQTVRLDQLLDAVKRPSEAQGPPDITPVVAALRAVNAAVAWKAGRVSLGPIALDEVNLSAQLEDGRLAVKPVTAGYLGGHLRGALDLDLQGEEPAVALEMEARRLDLGRTLARLTVSDQIEGAADFTLSFSTRGSTLDSLLTRATLYAAVGPSKFLVRPESNGRPVSFHVSSAEISAAPGQPITLQLKSLLGGQPLILTAGGGPLSRLVAASQAWPVRLSARALGATATVKGTIASPWNRPGPGIDLAVAVNGARLSALSKTFPPVGPYELTGRVAGAGDTYRVSRLVARLAGSDVAGSATLALSGPRPHLTGTLTSKSVVLDSLIAPSGTRTGPGKHSPPLDFELPIERLLALDADLSWHVSRLIVQATHLGDLGLTVKLRDGRLHAVPVHTLVSGGTLRAGLDVDGSAVPPAASLAVTGRGIDYGRLAQVLGITERLAGRADFDLTLAGTGKSFQTWIRRASLSLATGPTTVTLHDPQTKKDLQLELGKAGATSKEGGPVQATLQGTFRTRAFTLTAAGGPMAGLVGRPGAWPLAVTTRTAGTSLDLKGELRLPLDGDNFLFDTHLKGDRLNELDPVLDRQLPALGPYELTGTLADTQTGYRLTELDARIEDSDVHGSLALTLGGSRPRLTGDLRSETLTLPAAAQPAAAAPAPSKDGRVIPEMAIPVNRLREVEVEIDLGWLGKRLVAGATELGEIALRARLESGRLQIAPFHATFSGGVIDGSLSLEAREQVPAVILTMAFQHLDFGRLLKAMKGSDSIEGVADIKLDLEGPGASLREFLARANGRIEFVGGPGRVKGRLLDYWAADLVSSLLSPGWRREDSTTVNCLVGRFGLADGFAQSDALLLDTTRVTVAGLGTVHLGTEQLDLLLTPKPKEAAFISLAHTARVQGPLSKPEVSTDKTDIAKSAAWLALGVVPPFGLAVGVAMGVAGSLSRLGTGVENPCEIARAEVEGDLIKPVPTSRGFLDRVQDAWGDFRSWLRKAFDGA
jgi:uncharacterized protein involved in outer membrane biogenesis